jgi:hypothetical protein
MMLETILSYRKTISPGNCLARGQYRGNPQEMMWISSKNKPLSGKVMPSIYGLSHQFMKQITNIEYQNQEKIAKIVLHQDNFGI